jgi:hypothetical protein
MKKVKSIDVSNQHSKINCLEQAAAACFAWQRVSMLFMSVQLEFPVLLCGKISLQFLKLAEYGSCSLVATIVISEV